MDLAKITDNGRTGKGILFVLSSVSGGGKTTIINHLFRDVPDLRLSISHTTRKLRSGERNGADYHFISEQEFTDMVDREEFLEWAEVYGHRYGTSKSEVPGPGSGRKDLVLDIDVQGGLQVSEKRPDAVLIFLLLPGEEEQEKRLRQRGTEPPEHLQKRIQAARGELATVSEYDYAVINNELEGAVDAVRSIIVSERCRISRNTAMNHQRED